MTVLADWEIRSLCEGSQMVWPFKPELLNPASIDVLLGDHLMVELPSDPRMERVSIAECSKESPYMLQPQQFVLAETQETFKLPDTVSAQFVLKSSRAREGYENLLAGWCDPGWHGSRLTLELVNARRWHPIPLYPGLKIGQMVFFRMSNVPIHNYALTGRYNEHSTVMGSADAKVT